MASRVLRIRGAVKPTVDVTSRYGGFLSRTALLVGAVVIALLFLFPMFWAIFTSFMPPGQANSSPPALWPSHFSFGNYGLLSRFGIGMLGYLRNSLAVTGLTIVGTLVLGALAGYGFSRFHFPGKNLCFILILSTMMIPFQTILVPLFLILNRLHLSNSLLGLGLVYITFQLPFAVFVMRNAFDAIPAEMEEAALVDGCGVLTAMSRVMIPLSVPGIMTVVLFAFLAAWNEFLAALILLNNEQKFTLPLMLLSAQSGEYGTVNWGVLQAGMTIAMIPALVVFVFLQRYYIEGLASGAVEA